MKCQIFFMKVFQKISINGIFFSKIAGVWKIFQKYLVYGQFSVKGENFTNFRFIVNSSKIVFVLNIFQKRWFMKNFRFKETFAKIFKIFSIIIFF